MFAQPAPDAPLLELPPVPLPGGLRLPVAGAGLHGADHRPQPAVRGTLSDLAI